MKSICASLEMSKLDLPEQSQLMHLQLIVKEQKFLAPSLKLFAEMVAMVENNQENHSYHPRFGIKFVIHRLETRLPAEQCAQQVSQTFKCDLCEGRMLLNLRVALLQVPNIEIN